MHHKVAITIMALSLGGCFILTAPLAAAQTGPQPQKIAQALGDGKKTVTPRAAPSRTVTPRTIRTRTVTPRTTRTRTVTTRTRTVTPLATRTRTVTAGRFLRGTRTTIRGRNFSVRRGGFRIRHGRKWRTFVALSALSAIVIGSSSYYPYAYISAPEPFCEGLTEDGCQLQWREVETIEGDLVGQCVAYCPQR